MQWQSEGVLLHIIPYGESSCIAKIFSADYGLVSGLVKGAMRPKQKPLLQQGNWLQIQWTGRLEQQLGQFSLDAMHLWLHVICHLASPCYWCKPLPNCCWKIYLKNMLSTAISTNMAIVAIAGRI